MTTADRIYRHLKQDIAACALRPGAPFSEAQLCRAMGQFPAVEFAASGGDAAQFQLARTGIEVDPAVTRGVQRRVRRRP